MATRATNSRPTAALLEGGPARARPAQFDRAAQHTRGLYAKIHIARQQLRMIEDDYRALLFLTTGRTSLKDCNTGQLEAMVKAMERKGFRPAPKAGNRGAATHPVAKKARALWISLHQLGAVRNPSEQALEAFARRQLGCERFSWARQSEGYRVIEALKSMARRAGWPQHDPISQKPLSPLLLQSGLCQAILAKLKAAGEVPAAWSLNDAAFRLCGIELGANGPVTAEQYHVLAGGLGAKLWAARPEGEGQ
jgi:phage gp16-like protein